MDNFDLIERSIERLGAKASLGSIGKSLLNRDIPYMHIGQYGGRQGLICGGIHAREYLTSLLLAEIALRKARRGDFKEGEGCYVLPLLNVDGALLCIRGEQTIDDPVRRQFLRRINAGKSDYALWKANANAVDLNVNFDAHWGEGLGNVREPAGASYVGERPHSEVETRAVVEFIERVKPFFTLSYHSKGQEIYWDFFQSGEFRAQCFEHAKRLAAVTGYRLIEGDGGSTGGLKDYCLQKLSIPSFTIEIIDDAYEHPLQLDSLIGEIERNEGVFDVFFD